jgi:hypothetical protein
MPEARLLEFQKMVSNYGVREDDTNSLDGYGWAQLEEIVALLSPSLDEVGIQQWMTRPNGYLKGAVPREELAGNLLKVREAADAYAWGYFT